MTPDLLEVEVFNKCADKVAVALHLVVIASWNINTRNEVV